MIKKCCRFYAGALASQENWLNRMAADGYRLIRTGKLLYEFEECGPGQYQYCVEYIGLKSRESAEDYARFLRECGYTVFFKNINLNWNTGKVVYRPWAEKGGRISSDRTTLNRELLIVEKENDGKPFELHTTYEDKVNYYKQLQKPWFFVFFMTAVMGVIFRFCSLAGFWVWLVFAAVAALELIVSQIELRKLKKQAQSKEW